MSEVVFSTTAALETKMVETTFDTTTTDLASACLVDASAEIRKKLSKRYDFSISPFTTTTAFPTAIKTICETLAIGYMYESLSRGGKDGFVRADRFIKRAMDNLTLIAVGDAGLIDQDGAVVDQISDDWVVDSNTKDYSSTFNEDDPKSWRVDPDKLDDIQSERET